MDHTPTPPQLIHHATVFMQMLDTLPIMPKEMVMELSQRQFNAQCATFFEYISRIGAILSRDNSFPEINVQYVEPQLKQHSLYIYFNLVKAMYLHFRGITDQARECCEKTFLVIKNNYKNSPGWHMVIWSYWLVHRQVSYFFKEDPADRL